VLSEKAFTFTPNQYLSIHKRLFNGIFDHAGTIRDYNVTKKEWVLDGDTVTYGSALDLKETLEYDLSVERDFSYKGLEIDEVIKHLARFVSNLWQIHVFKEGNTRTTAVFFIKYLRTLGFEATNDIFAENAWYFRNALVRANYSNIQKGIHETTEYVEVFLRNLLLNENNELHNREMHISGRYTSKKKPNIEGKKPNIEGKKPNIEGKKPNIGRDNLVDTIDIEQLVAVSEISKKQIQTLYKELGEKEYFGRSDVEQALNVKSFRSSEIIKLMKDLEIIIPVQGKGKGKYRFKLKDE
jgi:fido (protein-threonine AMPylation protein)